MKAPFIVGAVIIANISFGGPLTGARYSYKLTSYLIPYFLV